MFRVSASACDHSLRFVAHFLWQNQRDLTNLQDVSQPIALQQVSARIASSLLSES